MSISNNINGLWIYRSFRNAPTAVGDFSSLKVWEAELLLEVVTDSNVLQGHLGERPKVTGQNHPYLTVSGSFHDNETGTMNFRATGAKGTAFDGWIYDYQGNLSLKWVDSSTQSPTITGTVIRTVEHNGAPAGEVFSFIAVKKEFVEPRSLTTSNPRLAAVALPASVLSMLSSEQHRLHHQLWHGSRDEWDFLSDEKKNALRDINWQPGAPKKERAAIGRTMHTNASGEDFLFMHRRMIKMVNDIEPVSPWSRLPRPRPLAAFNEGFLEERAGNPDGFSVPPAWQVVGDSGTTNWFHQIKTMSTYESKFQVWEELYKNPDYLARISLGELGSRIEFTIHNWMHMRWASVTTDPKTGEVLPLGRHPLDFDPKWFAEEYDHLGETFSSHVHPVFWRLHGWVDARIDDWQRAQEETRPNVIKPRKLHGVDWFETDGNWVRIEEPWEGPRSGHGSGHHGLDLNPKVMKEALEIIFGDGQGAEISAKSTTGGVAARRGNWFKNLEIE